MGGNNLVINAPGAGINTASPGVIRTQPVGQSPPLAYRNDQYGGTLPNVVSPGFNSAQQSQGSAVTGNVGPGNLDINLKLSTIATQLAADSNAVGKIIDNAAALDASGGVSTVTTNGGVNTGVTASSSASALYDVTPVTAGTFNYASRALKAIDTVLNVIETNDAKAFKQIFANEGTNISDQESGRLFSQLQQNQSLIRTALSQSSARETVRNNNLTDAARTGEQRRQASNKLGQQPGQSGGGGAA
jgi:hypothetical protein